MAAEDIEIVLRGPYDVPSGYTLAPGERFSPSSISAYFDGTNAGGDFRACLSIYAQDGTLLGRTFPSTAIAAGDGGQVTFAPF